MTEYLDIVNTLSSYDIGEEWIEFKENLENLDLLEWHGSSINDRTQYYTLNF